jgi:hypothetical protein
MKDAKSTSPKKTRAARRSGVFVRMSMPLTEAVREFAASRRIPLQSVYEAAVTAYLSPGAQDQRDAMLGRQINRLSRGLESVDWNTKLLVAMLRYQIELDLSFLPEPVTEAERKIVTEKGTRRFDRFEQWLMRHLAEPEGPNGRVRGSVTPTADEFDKASIAGEGGAAGPPGRQ